MLVLNPTLAICDGFTLNLSDYTRTGLRVGIWASSGRGKSFGVGVFCEELLAAGIPVIAIDPEGELHTLREQYRVLVIGGEEGDLPLPPGRLGVQMALHRVMEEGLGLVVDLSDRPSNRLQQEAARPWLEELWALMSEHRAPAALVVEEVHIFAPQSGSSTTADIMQRFAKQGRKRGAILVAASQRTQAVSKEFMSQLNFSAIGGFETERDYDAVKAVVGSHIFDEFRSLETGRFYLSAVRGFFRWRQRRTTHGGDAPTWEPTEGVRALGRDSAMESLVEQLRTAFAEEAESDSSGSGDAPPAERAQIKALEQELRTAHNDLDAAREEVHRLKLALQVAGLVKVVIQQEVIATAPSLPVPAAAVQALAQSIAPAGGPTTLPAVTVVTTQARSVEPSLLKDVRLSPDTILGLAEVKSMLRKARERARRRSSRSPEYLLTAVKILLSGTPINGTEMAARHGYYGKDTIRRMEVALDALGGVGFAVYRNGQYWLNEAHLRQLIVRP